MEQLPLWTILLLSVFYSAFAVEIGFRVGTRIKPGSPQEPDNATQSMVQATMALLAFLLAFTFSIAAERYNDRRLLVIDEANSIGTTYLRADFLPDSSRDEIKKLLRQYVVLRVNRAKDISEFKQRLATSDEIQDLLWKETVVATKDNLDTPKRAQFISTLNETIDLQSKRAAAALYARIPDVVWYSLYAVIFFCFVAMGYQNGCARNRNWLPTLALIASFSLVLMLVADLDRPNEGFLKSDLQPMFDLGKKFGIRGL